MAPANRIWTVEEVFQLISEREGIAMSYARNLCGERDAEEALDAAISIMVAKIVGGHYIIEAEGQAWTLFCNVLRTQARNNRSRAARAGSWSFDEDRDCADDESGDPTRTLLVAEALQHLRECIEALDLNQKTVLLRRMNGDRVEDIASELNVSIATVSRLHQRALSLVRAHFEATE